ncbi:MAG: molybdate ABC transporter substrate-binding protein [Bacteroidales bacterium]|nr:molybdate ABC transporter substrate-binding protein [Bacteroidales bacterium]
MKRNYTPSIRKLILITLTALSVICTSCGSKRATDENTILVYSAASLTDVLSEIIDSFELKYPVKVQTNLASSGTLARQIEQGGAPDVFISASKRWADYVDSSGYLLSGFKTEIARNELVLIAPANSSLQVAAIDSSLNFVSLLGKERLSMGDPTHVPAGSYARQSLDYFGWTSKLKGKILPAKDVPSALMLVEMEEVPLGIVYRTDAEKSQKVKILCAFPQASHNPIVYVGGVCSNKALAKEFFRYLNSEETVAIWAKYSFVK